MRTLLAVALGGFLAALAIPAHSQRGSDGWVTLFDGKNLDQWNPIGNANWRIEDGAVVANKGNGFLVSKESYGDFQLKVEFWVNDAANSGIFIRSEDPQKITGATAYEVNIYDERPDPTYGTGAIVNVAKVDPMPKAGGKWNTYEITAKGDHLTAVLNGVKTADGEEGKHKNGHIACNTARRRSRTPASSSSARSRSNRCKSEARLPRPLTAEEWAPRSRGRSAA